MLIEPARQEPTGGWCTKLERKLSSQNPHDRRFDFVLRPSKPALCGSTKDTIEFHT